jgi:hypothetical protein
LQFFNEQLRAEFYGAHLHDDRYASKPLTP